MRTTILAVLLIVVCLVPGCSGGGCTDSAYEAWKREALAAKEASIPADKLDQLRKDAEESGGIIDAKPTQRDKAREKLDSAANAIGWVAGLCALAALGTLILSFMVPFIPTKTSAGCFAAALGGYGLQYVLLVYGVLFAEIAIWIGVVVLLGMGASVLIPWAIATVGYLQARTGKKLIAEGDERAGVALIAAAAGLPKSERKDLLKDALDRGPDASPD